MHNTDLKKEGGKIIKWSAEHISFYVLALITNYQSQILSHKSVFWVFPMAKVAVLIMKSGKLKKKKNIEFKVILHIDNLRVLILFYI